MKKVCFFLLALLALSAHAQTPLEKIRQFTKAQEHAMLTEYFEFLAIPNHANDAPNIARNTQFIEKMMQKRGISTRLLPSNTPNTPPAVYGEINTPGATQTIIFYAHYDGQPVSPEKWHPSVQPYVPVLVDKPVEKGGKIQPFPTDKTPVNPEWRISCRSSSDDKAGVMSIINAYDALVKSGLKPKWNIKFFFEGEEEIGSVHLGEILDRHKSMLTADLWLIADGPVHQSGLPMLDYGVRGDVNVDLKVYGPKRPLHSGHYGNWAPNPCLKMAKLLAGMKDEQGMVTVKGYYDDVVPFGPMEKQAFAAIPAVDAQMQKELGIKTPEGGGRSLFDAYELPSLNINGIRCADAGEKAANVIPTEAIATLDLRQVLGTDYLRQIERIKQHIEAQGYLVLDRDPTDEERLQHSNIAKLTYPKGGYNAQRTPLDLPISQKVVQAVKKATGEKLIIAPTSGGSLPLYLFEKHLDSKVINLCVANHDNNQHSENENVKIQKLWDGIEQLAMIMLMD